MSKKSSPAPKKGPSWLLISIFVVLAVAVGLYAFNRQKNESTDTSSTPSSASLSEVKESQAPPASSDHEEHAKSQSYRIPPYFEDPGAAGVLLPTKDPSIVTPFAQAGYVVAQKDPALLAQLPCFCYCDKFGHKSLHDCFVTEHAESCDICLKEAIEADELKAQGMTPEEIRSVIIAKYHPRNQGG